MEQKFWSVLYTIWEWLAESGWFDWLSAIDWETVLVLGVASVSLCFFILGPILLIAAGVEVGKKWEERSAKKIFFFTSGGFLFLAAPCLVPVILQAAAIVLLVIAS
ncbi:hypothetical protein IH979_02240, partial [Patescibacteria group bacterium]|nr:hypothetical protein [Patescibacteria group bacterium]